MFADDRMRACLHSASETNDTPLTTSWPFHLSLQSTATMVYKDIDEEPGMATAHVSLYCVCDPESQDNAIAVICSAYWAFGGVLHG